MTQLVPSLSNPTIGNLFNQWTSSVLDIQPDFQRKFVWTYKHQEQFIDTILKGLPFPEIYTAVSSTDRETLQTKSIVIDGQQRLTTIFNYISGNEDFVSKTVPTFKNLTDDQLDSFLSYKVVVRDLGKISDNEIKDIFHRINLTKFNLDDVEIHNAVYDGDFISTAKESLKFLDYLSDLDIFSDSQLTRMADLQYILLIMSTIEYNAYFVQNKKIEEFIIQFNSEYPNKHEMLAKLELVFSYLKELGIESTSIWTRKSNFFTLFIELSKREKLPDLSEFKSVLDIFEQNVLESKKDQKSNYFNYYNAMFQGTNHRGNRIIRGKYIEDLLNSIE
ncbi:DUF262 domain-containing protein [Acinetobacter sp. I-MWF]|uniref:DUF262 domain-containing protein n=1 Tax=Acinetobacter sp. I-MWF TaxID=2940517 RepID=UPI0021C836F0|nr:DUF262 domain-containing protein [Acinetobacter sp. I-MWF]MCT9977298.1 DUF262 domain-containing protein [Acinetobacter sp. I-MWF]